MSSGQTAWTFCVFILAVDCALILYVILTKILSDIFQFYEMFVYLWLFPDIIRVLNKTKQK